MVADPLNKEERSVRMSKVRGTGNKSTEGRVEQALIAAGIEGWEKHRKDIPGKPDFFFPQRHLILFVDGCFWHACPVCNRRTPSNHGEFWRNKIEETRRRDNRKRRHLRQDGYHVMRVWEHQLKSHTWLKRLRTMLRKLETASSLEAALEEH